MRIHNRVLASGAAFALLGCVAFAAPAPKPPKPAKPVAARSAKPSAPPKPVGPLTLIMRGLDQITGRPTTLLVPIGKSAQFATLTVTARYCYSTPSTETDSPSRMSAPAKPSKPSRKFSGTLA